MHSLFHILNASFYPMFKAQCIVFGAPQNTVSRNDSLGAPALSWNYSGSKSPRLDLDLRGATAQTRVTTLSCLHCF